MDYEKKYKEALERANDIKSGKVKLDEGELVTDYIFPELAESEDEKIRKAILNHLKKMWGNSEDDVCGIHVEDAISWLEKQKPVEAPQWMAYFLNENRSKFASSMDGYDEEREAEGKLLVIIDWLEKTKTDNSINHFKADNSINHFKADNFYVSHVDGKIHDATYVESEQKPIEWSEEDDRMLQTLVLGIGCYTYFSGLQSEDVVNWLKSLKQKFKEE